MIKDEDYISEFIDSFDEKYKQFVSAQVKMGLIRINTIKYFLIVTSMRELQYVNGLTYTDATKIQAEKYNLSERRIRFIYAKYRFFDKKIK
jgi:hypothetical protein